MNRDRPNRTSASEGSSAAIRKMHSFFRSADSSAVTDRSPNAASAPNRTKAPKARPCATVTSGVGDDCHGLRSSLVGTMAGALTSPALSRSRP
jgi:hypothetical protein